MPNKHFYKLAQEAKTLCEADASPAAAERLSAMFADEDIKSYTLSNLENPDWFSFLLEAGYFDATEAPGPLEDPENGGFFSFPTWSVLPYLHKIAKHAAQADDENLAKMLFAIITDVSQPSDGTAPRDNPRTWSAFVKILVILPNEWIRVEILELIPVWLKSRFRMKLTDADICRELLPKFLQTTVEHDNDPVKAAVILDKLLEVVYPDSEGSRAAQDREVRLACDGLWLSGSLLRGHMAKRAGEQCDKQTIILIADRLLTLYLHEYISHSATRKITKAAEPLWLSLTIDDGLVYTIEIHDSDPDEETSEPIAVVKSDGAIHNAESFKLFWDNKLLPNPTIAERQVDADPHDLYFGLFSGTSYIRLKTFDNRHVEREIAPKSLLSLVLLEMLLGRFGSGDEEGINDARTLLNEMIVGKYVAPIFKRIAFYVIGEHWDKLNDLFWSEINKPYGRYYFDDLEYEKELYEILQAQAATLSNTEKLRLSAIIEAGPGTGQATDAQIAYWKQTWYSALISIDEFKAKYDELRQETGLEEDVNFGRPVLRRGSGESPYSVKDLTAMPIRDIVEQLASFRGKDFFGPNVRALSQVLGNAVKESPHKFATDLEKFENTTFLYVYEILSGFREAWKSGTDIDWKQLFGFLHKYTAKSEFWTDALVTPDDRWEANHRTIIGELSWLIQDGTLNDERAMPEECNAEAEKLLLNVISRLEVTEGADKLRDDPVNDVLNSTYGRVITAIVYLSLRVARLEFGEKSGGDVVRWKAELRAFLDTEMKKQTPAPHAYVLIGQYMPQLLYLDKRWTEKHREAFIDLPDNMWYLFMYGYMFGNHQYANYYSKMLPHYERALGTIDAAKNWEELFLDHLALGYMAGISEFGLDEDDLLGRLIAEWSPKRLKYIVQQMSRHPRYDKDFKPEEPGNIGNRLFELWKKIHSRVTRMNASELVQDDKELLSNFLPLTVWMPELTDEFTNWLVQAAPFANVNYNATDFVEYLSYVAGRGDIEAGDRAERLSRIYSAMLDANVVPYYQEEHIEKIVEFIYQSPEHIGKANEIVDRYAREGHHFLRKFWERYGRSAS